MPYNDILQAPMLPGIADADDAILAVPPDEVGLRTRHITEVELDQVVA